MSKKLKTVVRRYFSKKKGWVEKVYTYEKDYNKRTVILSKTGKMTKKGKKRLDEMYENMSLTQKSEAESYVRTAMENNQRLTDQGLLSQIAHNRREKMIINAGSDLQQTLDELNTTELEYFDERNWENNVFTNAQGQKFKFEFNYDGSLWVEQ